MFEPGPNDTLSQNFMKLGLLVAEKNVDRHTHTQTRFMLYKYRLIPVPVLTQSAAAISPPSCLVTQGCLDTLACGNLCVFHSFLPTLSPPISDDV